MRLAGVSGCFASFYSSLCQMSTHPFSSTFITSLFLVTYPILIYHINIWSGGICFDGKFRPTSYDWLLIYLYCPLQLMLSFSDFIAALRVVKQPWEVESILRYVAGSMLMALLAYWSARPPHLRIGEIEVDDMVTGRVFFLMAIAGIHYMMEMYVVKAKVKPPYHKWIDVVTHKREFRNQLCIQRRVYLVSYILFRIAMRMKILNEMDRSQIVSELLLQDEDQATKVKIAKAKKPKQNIREDASTDCEDSVVYSDEVNMSFNGTFS